DWFTDSGRAQASILLGENRDDADLYLLMGRAYAARLRWKLRLDAEVRGGGGSTTEREFRGASSTGRLVLCIVYSDKRCHKGGMGSTARAPVDASSDVPRFQHVEVLPVRELENLLPLEYLGECLSRHGNKNVGHLREAVRRVTGDWLDHADLKDGVCLLDIM